MLLSCVAFVSLFCDAVSLSHFCLAIQMDADYDESQAVNQNMQQGGRKRKGRSRFSCVVRQEKPVFDPSMKRFLSY